MVTPNDAALLERIASGESAALAELMDRFGPGLMRYATHFLQSADDADEVLQDTFVRAERAIRRGVRPLLAAVQRAFRARVRRGHGDRV